MHVKDILMNRKVHGILLTGVLLVLLSIFLAPAQLSRATGLAAALPAGAPEAASDKTLSLSAPSAPLGSAFTYQGQLEDGGALAEGSYDLSFALYDSLLNGAQQGITLTLEDVSVTEGLFTVSLDFGSSVFNGEQRFLQIGARPGASVDPFTALDPRQEVSAAPYALYALNAASVGSLQSPPPLRTYYLSTTQVQGNAALTACIAGYHTASLAEIFDVTALRYASELPQAATSADAGSGPPFSLVGWVRTGAASSVNTTPGNANCAVWTSNAGGDNGTAIGLNPQWALAAENISPWDSLVSTCSTNRRVWCVEDYSP